MPTGLATSHATAETTSDLDRFVQSLEADPSGSTTYFFLLGLQPTDQFRIQAIVHEGVPYTRLETFRHTVGLSIEQTAQLIQTPVRTLTRRRRDGRLRPDETDRLFRAAWVVARALALYDGHLPRARQWLESPQFALGGLVPFTLAGTFDGARQVSDVIGRIEHGLGIQVVTAWRLVKTVHAKAAFTGEGAAQFGSRWNPPGVRVVYTAQTAALAAMEVLVQTPEYALPGAHTIFRVQFPKEALTALDPAELPADWDAIPPPLSTQTVAPRWITGGSSLVLRVPSVAIRQECNYLINPAHPGFPSLQISTPEPFVFDPRLSARAKASASPHAPRV